MLGILMTSSKVYEVEFSRQPPADKKGIEKINKSSSISRRFHLQAYRSSHRVESTFEPFISELRAARHVIDMDRGEIRDNLESLLAKEKSWLKLSQVSPTYSTVSISE